MQRRSSIHSMESAIPSKEKSPLPNLERSPAHKRKAAIINSEGKIVISKEYEALLNNLDNNIKYYESQGFTQLVHRLDLGNIGLPDYCKPLEDYSNQNEMPLADAMSFRLFAKDGQLYKVPFNLLLKKVHPTLSLISNKPTQGIYLIVLKQLSDNRLVFELRVTFTDSGHVHLLRAFEHDAIVAAGELFTKNHKLSLGDDKTGHFYNLLEKYKTLYRKIFELFFPPDKFDYLYYHLPELTLSEDEKKLPNKEQAEILGRKYHTVIKIQLDKLNFYAPDVSTETTQQSDIPDADANPSNPTQQSDIPDADANPSNQSETRNVAKETNQSETQNVEKETKSPILNTITETFTTFSTPRNLLNENQVVRNTEEPKTLNQSKQ